MAPSSGPLCSWRGCRLRWRWRPRVQRPGGNLPRWLHLLGPKCGPACSRPIGGQLLSYHHSTWTFASLTTPAVHLAISAFTWLANSGRRDDGCAEIASSSGRLPGSAIALSGRFVEFLHHSPAACLPVQTARSRYRSHIPERFQRRSSRHGARSLVVTPSARSVPPFICDEDDGRLSNIDRHLVADNVIQRRTGTFVGNMLQVPTPAIFSEEGVVNCASRACSSPDRWSGVPLPEEA